MAPPTLPPSLTVAYWSKQVGLIEKPPRMPGLLGDLKSRVDKLPTDLLDLGDVADPPAAARREQALKGEYDKSARALADLCGTVADLAGDLAARFKKDAGSAKQAAPAAATVAKEASSFGRAVQDASAKALNELKALATKLEAAAQKAQAEQAKADKKAAGEEGDDSVAGQKDEKTFRDSIKGRMKSAMNGVKREGAAPAKFRARVLGKNWGIFVSKADGGPQDKIAWRLIGHVGGAKPIKGQMLWDAQAKAFVFESAAGPSGASAANNLAASLKGIIGFRPKVRLQKPGQRGDDSDEGEADPDELEDRAVAAEGKKADEKVSAPDATSGKTVNPSVEPTKGFTARLEALMPRIQAAVKKAGVGGKKILGAVEDAGKLAKGNRVGLAEKMLDRVESMIAEVDKAQRDDKVGPAFAKLAGEWAKVRSAAIAGVDQLAAHIETEYADDPDQAAQVKQAVSRLRDAARQLKPDLDTLLKALADSKSDANRERITKGVRTAVNATRKLLQVDPLLKEVDGNELMPSLRVIKPMLDTLSRAESALG
ncbi:MAG: hypothetical protein ACKVQR_13070 [Aquabacterium sp.]